MSITRDTIISISSDSEDNNLYYKIGLAYYTEKLLEIGNDPIIPVKSHIRNNYFDTHKNNALLSFDAENYESALSSLNNIIRNKYKRIIDKLREDIQYDFFYILGKTYFHCALKNSVSQNQEHHDLPLEITTHTEMEININAKTTEVIEEEMTPEVVSEEMTPDVIDEEGLIFNIKHAVEKTSEMIAREHNLDIKSQNETQNTTIIHSIFTKEDFYKKKKYHLFQLYQANSNSPVEIKETNEIKIKLDAPIMSKTGKSWKVRTVTVSETKPCKPAKSFFTQPTRSTCKKKKLSQTDEDYIPSKKAKK